MRIHSRAQYKNTDKLDTLFTAASNLENHALANYLYETDHSIWQEVDEAYANYQTALKRNLI